MSLSNVQFIDIKALKLTETNPRKIDRNQFAKLCDSITEDPDFLLARPVLAQRIDGELWVYAGNQRVRAAKKLGWKQIPCIVDDEPTEERIKRRIVIDNVHHGEWCYDLLAAQYDPVELLSLGMLENDLHIDLGDGITKADTQDNDCNKCPECGQKLKKRK
jgi:ParB-like chromosome segregation protein Spo0J